MMEPVDLQLLSVDWIFFSLAFARDVDFHDTFSQSTFLDRDTGEIIWVFEDDDDAESAAGISPEENQATWQLIEEAPERYLEIPGLDHGDHHEILRAFLNSDWTDDEGLRRTARDAYAGSIGGWKDAVNDRDIVHAFHDFQEQKATEMAEDFLRSHGIEPEWT